MSRKHKLRKLLLCAVLEMGALMGAPMRPEEIDNLMRIVRQDPPHYAVSGDGNRSGDAESGGANHVSP